MKKKLISMLLAAVMVLSVTACGQAEVVDSSVASDAVVESDVADAGEVVYPLGAEDETIKIAMMSYNFKIAGDCTNIADTPFWEQYEKNLGVNLEVEMFETEDAFNLMLAGGDLPDIIMWGPELTNGGREGMLEDEIITTLSWDELEKWAPDYAAEVKANDTVRKMLTMSNGEIVGFGNWSADDRMRSTNGLIVRGDWMDELGIENPTTPEEFLDMLRAFKNEKGAEYPMALTSHRMNLLFSYGFFSSPYGLVNSQAYVDLDGKYHLGYYEPEHKEVLKFFHTMYEEGLINPDYLTLEQTAVDGMLYDGRTGVVQQSVISGLGSYIPAMAEVNPDAELRGIPSLLGPNGERAFYGATELLLSAFQGIVTTACENKELAMKVLNYGYTPEGQLFMSFGTEGVSYEMVDGVPVYTDLITKDEQYVMGQMLHQYCRAGSFWPWRPMYEYFVQTTSHPIQQAAVVAWNENDRYVYMPPYISVAEEDMAEYSRISTDVSTYASEMRAKFVSGEVDIDAEFDNYIQGLKDRGIETMIEMMQNAIDAFNAL
ncbi:MAG: extracellular solute-binding protein [Lachnospiraceae bacterium]|nr:extracellular solute-binding protein [Lachnospiraceae bacterium]